jgi:hypothetical protein
LPDPDDDALGARRRADVARRRPGQAQAMGGDDARGTPGPARRL